ncbi:helix-turn-helix domain-containing protein [Mediterraneibacter agrestimuris]
MSEKENFCQESSTPSDQKLNFWSDGVLGISANTMAKLSHNDMVLMDFIVRICRNLNCTADDLWISYLKL